MGLPFQVFAFGLLTVFVVLLVVVATGNAIIWVVNRFFAPPPAVASANDNKDAIPGTGHIAAITAAVQSVTRGKGTIRRVEQLKGSEKGS